MPGSLLVAVVLSIGVFGLTALIGSAVWIISSRSKLSAEARAWPTTEARIQNASTTVLGRYSGPIPCFSFSYVVDGEYYSGSFGLSADGDRADTLARELIDKKILVSYDPDKPSKFYVPEETIEGCEVKQIDKFLS
jgi:hypothetical protein